MTFPATRFDRMLRPAPRAAGRLRALAPALAVLVALTASAAEDAGNAAVRAQALTAEATAAMRDHRLEAARAHYLAAIAADPAFVPARDGLREVEAVLAGQPAAATAGPVPTAVREQLALVEATAAIERAELLARAGRVAAGREALALARERLTPLAHRGSADQDLARVHTLLDDLTVRDVDQERVSAAREREAARAGAEAATAQAERVRLGSFAEQVDRIEATRGRGHVDLALAQCRRLVRDYPGEPRAETLYSELLDLAHGLRRRQFDDQQHELRQQVMERLHDSLIPSGYDGLPIYPPGWLQRHEARIDIGQETVAYEPWQEQILDRLAGRITVDFENLAIEEALGFVAKQAGFNLVVDPAVYANGGKLVTLRAADIRLDYTLNWLGRLADTSWVVAKGAVYFGGQQQEEAVLAVYDLSHLVRSPYDQPGPTIGFGEAGGAVGGAANIFTPAVDTSGEQVSPEDVVDTIKAAISPATWEQAGNGIEIRGNILYVTAPKRVHQLLAEFIREQANARNLAVHVSAKWLTLSEGYLEEIGVNWGGAANLLRLGDLLQVAPGFRSRSQTSDTVGGVASVLPSAAVLAPAPDSGLNLSGLFLDRIQVSAVLRAIEQKDHGRILASPEVTTLNGVRSHAFFGRQYAYIADYEIVASNLDPTIEVLTIGASLDVKPYVSADRKYVTMEFRQALADVQFFTELIQAPRVVQDLVLDFSSYPIELPNIFIREVSTTVIMPDRGSLLVGGFGQHVDQSSSAKVPFLGHIPYLGRLFGTRGRYSQRSHLYLLATVDIINYQEAEEHL